MIEKLSEIFAEFRKQGVADSLKETLRLADLISGGALRRADLSLLGEETDLAGIVRQRAGGKPLEYILGVAPFLGELLECREGALIPREETELLTLTCLGFIQEQKTAGVGNPKIIELGTGSGNIAVLLALKTENAEIYASDISEEAMEVAASNVERCGVTGKVTLMAGDMFEPMRGRGLEGATDLVVCNPPYIPSTSVDRLDPQIIDHEPRLAFDAGAYGLDIFQRLIKGAPEFLKSGGMLAFEIGAGQEKIVARLFRKAGDIYSAIERVDDGNEIRVFTAIRT
ncbi:MAG: peptide chain release factor N(5)-glutamine methyltransferase [Candidatus Krumholzibacteria bacterium]|nr:peptide chain release factor N(5)-glutamine methyltransferase [Candidatus Krumholzibacteria bacterium]